MERIKLIFIFPVFWVAMLSTAGRAKSLGG